MCGIYSKVAQLKGSETSEQIFPAQTGHLLKHFFLFCKKISKALSCIS
jgi:hypothetical protein